MLQQWPAASRLLHMRALGRLPLAAEEQVFHLSYGHNTWAGRDSLKHAAEFRWQRRRCRVTGLRRRGCTSWSSSSDGRLTAAAYQSCLLVHGCQFLKVIGQKASPILAQWLAESMFFLFCMQICRLAWSFAVLLQRLQGDLVFTPP